MPSLIAAVGAVSLTVPAFAAYTLTNGITASATSPFTSTNTPASATPASYTAVSVTLMSASSTPNGAYVSTIIGTATGTSGGASVNTGFAYDAVNGFRLVGLYTLTSAGGHSNTQIRGANGVGQVIGNTPVNSTQSSDVTGILGTDAWLYTTAGNTNVSIGLTGTNFTYTKNVPVNGTITPLAFSGAYHSSNASYINDAGTVVGSTSRYGGDAATTPSTSLGSSTWRNVAGTTSEIGLFGAGYSYTASTGTGTSGRFSSGSISGLNATGAVMGSASAYFDRGDGTATALGQDGWIYDGTATTAVGFFQRGIDPDVQGFNALGYKYSSTPVGTVGTTPASSLNRMTTLNGINASGQVAGISNYYSGTGFKGQDAFVYTPATATYRQVGLYANTGNFSNGVTPAAGSSSFVSNAGARSTSINFINNAGKSVGTSTQYLYYSSSTGVVTAASGTAAWIDDGTTTTRIGLFNQSGDPLPTQHLNPQTGASSTSITNLTNSGLVGGFPARYYGTTSAGYTTGTQFGQDAWVYNSITGTTYLVDPIDAAANKYTASSILYLSDDGYAVGQYSVGTGLTNSGAYNKAFLWSAANGFVDLGTSLSPSLSTTAYQNLIAAYYTSAGGGTIYATASNTVSATINGIVSLTPAVPEPTSLAAIAVGDAALLRRRRRLPTSA